MSCELIENVGSVMERGLMDGAGTAGNWMEFKFANKKKHVLRYH